MTDEFNPDKPRSRFLTSGYPTCVTYNPYTGEYYGQDVSEVQKTMRGHMPALAPVMAMQAANESAAYAVQVFLPQARSCNNAQDLADCAIEAFSAGFDEPKRERLAALEFGVGTGGTTRYLGERLGNTALYGFDWFYGLTEAWTDFQKQGRWSQNGKLPENLPSNVRIVEGKFQETLEDFLKEHKKMDVGFVHMDADTYASTKYVLGLVIPRMVNGSILLFDEYFNFPGWSKPQLGEASAWHEIVKKFKLTVEPLCFALEHQSTAWKIVANPAYRKRKIGARGYTKLPPIEAFMTRVS